MRRWAQIVALALAIGPAIGLAQAPDASLRPMPRPATFGVTERLQSVAAPARSLRPMPRPTRSAPVAALPAPAPAAARAEPVADPVIALVQTLSGARIAPVAAAVVTPASGLAVPRSARPVPRPNDIAQLAAAVISAPRAVSRKGSVCGVPEIKGEALAPIPGPGACGIDQPVRVTSVSGIAVRQAPTIDCTTARALNDWVRNGVIPAVGRTGGGVARVNVIAHYSCRTRNSKPGARLSEHSFGHALDISGVTLKDGSTLTVLDHWRAREFGRIIKAMHSSACGPFGTVLGPNSDRYHQDHLHLDTARYRGGPYCR